MFETIVQGLERAVGQCITGDAGAVAAAAKRLSLLFTSERRNLPQDYLSDPDLLSAYAAGFLIPNAVKVVHCLAQAAESGALPSAREFKILDIGAGPGTASLAASAYLAATHPSAQAGCLAVEQNAGALVMAGKLFSAAAPSSHSFECIRGVIGSRDTDEKLGDRRFDIIVAANLINELGDVKDAQAILESLIQRNLSEGGILIVIDPALNKAARSIMQLRDLLIETVGPCITAPCPHNGPCPMLKANDRDWCHFYIEWKRPLLTEKIDALANMNHRHLKMSYFILKPNFKEPQRETEGPCDLMRAVSSPLDSKGKRELVVCTCEGELRRVRRTNTDASDVNGDYDRVKRGDIVRCGPEARIRRDKAFSIVKRWLNIT